MTTPTPEERAREIAERHPWICSDQGHKSSADALLKDIAQALLATRNETIEECAKVAERYGCGKPGCTDCYAGAAAADIRNLRKGG